MRALLDFDCPFDKLAIEQALSLEVLSTSTSLTDQRLRPGYGLEDEIRSTYKLRSSTLSERLAAAFREETGLVLGPNVALGKPATQSSTTLWSRELSPDQDAAGAVDGEVNGFYSFHTEADQPGPWWSVDLCEIFEIMEIRAFNYLASAGVADRIRHLVISLSQDGVIWSVGYRHEGKPAFGGADGSPLIWRPTVARTAGM